MAIGSKFHRDSPVDHVLVSQSTRRDAKPVNDLKFETYRDEMNHWISIKKRTEADLAGYSKAAFSSEQARVRREHPRDSDRSFNAWIKRKSEMEAKRRELVERNAATEDEILRLKPLVSAEMARSQIKPSKSGPGSLDQFVIIRDDGTLSWDGIAAQLLLEMRMIRTILEEMLDRSRSQDNKSSDWTNESA